MSINKELSRLSGIDEGTIDNLLRTLVFYHFLLLLQNKSFDSFYGKMELVDNKLVVTQPNELVQSILDGNPTTKEFIKTQVVNVINDV